MHPKSYCKTCGEDHGRGDLRFEAQASGDYEPYDCDICCISKRYEDRIDKYEGEIKELKNLLKECTKHIDILFDKSYSKDYITMKQSECLDNLQNKVRKALEND